jgi:hypothetical protein
VFAVSTALLATVVAVSTALLAADHILSTKFSVLGVATVQEAEVVFGATCNCPVIGSGLPRSLAKNLTRDFTARSKVPSVGTAGVAGAAGAVITGAGVTHVGIHSGIFASGVIAMY